MDIIDIMLARAMTPQGQTDIYVNKANKAAAKAEKAQQDAAAAIATVDAAAGDIADAKAAANQLLEDAQDVLEAAQEALQTAEQAQINTLDIDDVDDEIKRMTVNTNVVNGNNANTLQVITTYPDDSLNTQNITKLYKSTGQNEDGTMTQKAITAALASIPQGGGNGGSGTTNLGPENAGYVVIVGEDGNITAGDTSEESIIEALVKAGAYIAKDGIGVQIDYENKSTIRTQGATYLNKGSDFDMFPMYGGRMRCNVLDNGTITAFYGDSNYKDDGSNGQVMVYQPKFYYQRIPMKLESNSIGQIVRKESLILSATPQAGFKLHPAFIGPTGDELEYILLAAYNGSINGNKLSSVANVKPASKMTIVEAEAYARNRGTGWHITNMAAESLNQMLEIVEFGSMNGQASLENGIVSIPTTTGYNCASHTGSTASLGNTTGAAASTLNVINGVSNTYTTNGKRAISYRGIENPWGNIWRMVAGINIVGGNNINGGTPYVCKNFNYNINNITVDYESIGFCLPTQYGWISAMGYGSDKYDWIFMPAECADTANSVAPVGDNLWTDSAINNLILVIVGGSWGFGQSCGPFYYACDNLLSNTSQYAYGANLMYIPTINNIYSTNYSKWQAKFQG